MRKIKFVTMFGVSCGLGLSTAFVGHAQTVLTVNPDGTVSQVETGSSAGSRSLPPSRSRNGQNRNEQVGNRNFQPIPDHLRRGRPLNDGIGPRNNRRDRDDRNRDGRGRDDWGRGDSRYGDGRYGDGRYGDGRYGHDERGNVVIIGDNTDVYINQPGPGHYTGYPGYGYGYPQAGYDYYNPGYGYPYGGTPYGTTTNVYIGGVPRGYAYGSPYDYRSRQSYSIYAPGVVVPSNPYPGYGMSYGSPYGYGNPGFYGGYGNYSSRTTTTRGGLGGGFSIGSGGSRFSIGGGRQTSTTTVTTRTFP